MQQIMKRALEQAFRADYNEVFFFKEDIAELGGITLCELNAIILLWESKPKSCKYLEELRLLFELDRNDENFIEKDFALAILEYCAFELKRGQAISFITYIAELGFIESFGGNKKAEFRDCISPDIANVTEKEKKRSKKLETKEGIISKRIARDEKGEREVNTPSGRIDVLTDSAVIEVKESSAWKGGLGQLQAYQIYYPEHSKRLHLFGDVPKNLSDIKYACTILDVNLTCEWD